MLGKDDQQKGSDLREKRKTRLPEMPSPRVRIFHFQDGGDVTNLAGPFPCVLPRKCKSSPISRPGPKIADKSQQIPRYAPVCPRGRGGGEHSTTPGTFFVLGSSNEK